MMWLIEGEALVVVTVVMIALLICALAAVTAGVLS